MVTFVFLSDITVIQSVNDPALPGGTFKGGGKKILFCNFDGVGTIFKYLAGKLFGTHNRP